MNIEKLIHEIIELDKKIDDDVELHSYLETNDLCDRTHDIIGDRLLEELSLFDSLKTALADTVVKAYTGIDVSAERERG